MCEQCGREELTADQPKQKVKYVRKAHKKPVPEVPACVHTKETGDSIDHEVEDLMLTCSVLTRAQARAMEGVLVITPPEIRKIRIIRKNTENYTEKYGKL